MNDDLAAEAATWVPPWQRPANEARDDDAFADDADDPGCEIVGEAEPGEADAEPAEVDAEPAEVDAEPESEVEAGGGLATDADGGVGLAPESEPAVDAGAELAAEAEGGFAANAEGGVELAAGSEPVADAGTKPLAEHEGEPAAEGEQATGAGAELAADFEAEDEAGGQGAAAVAGQGEAAGLPHQWAGLAGTRWLDSARADEEPDPSVAVEERAGADDAPIIVPEQREAEERLPAVSDGELPPALEAILMVVDEPVNEITLAQVLDVTAEQVANALIDLSAAYTREGRGFDLRRAAGGWRFYTRGDYSAYVEKFVLDGQQMRLTQASLETLAVVAYKQPVTRSRISAIRGVNCDGVIRTLVTRGMIEECGTDPDSGAHLYRTTTLFLEKLGLDSVEQLPPLAPFLPDNLDEVAAGG